MAPRKAHGKPTAQATAADPQRESALSRLVRSFPQQPTSHMQTYSSAM
jgi:hypothetical protein